MSFLLSSFTFLENDFQTSELFRDEQNKLEIPSTVKILKHVH
jgi:hypothetical protein